MRQCRKATGLRRGDSRVANLSFFQEDSMRSVISVYHGTLIVRVLSRPSLLVVSTMPWGDNHIKSVNWQWWALQQSGIFIWITMRCLRADPFGKIVKSGWNVEGLICVERCFDSSSFSMLLLLRIYDVFFAEYVNNNSFHKRNQDVFFRGEGVLFSRELIR